MPPITIKGVPVLIHWTFPTGGVFLAFFVGDTSLVTMLSMVTAYTILILVHEFGHAIAAKAFSLNVHAVLVTAAGGWCYADEPTTIRSKLIFYGGGLIAQVILLTVTTIALLAFDNPPPKVFNPFILVFTVVNVALLIVNVYPSDGTDGKLLWGLVSEYKQKA